MAENFLSAAPGEAVVLAGPARARGRGQAAACPDAADSVRNAVRQRLDGARGLLQRPGIARHLDRQWEFAARHDAEGLAELEGLGDGFGLPVRDLFAYLHLGQLAGLPETDGCTAWAVAHPELGALLVKNRDFRGEHQGLQRVFLHRDPVWGGRAMLCVGSLGSPGAYSSGINSDGFALADTQVVTTDQGVGMLRYFMMTRLLARCALVAEAIEELRAVPQAGGGCLVLADATGAVAAVEIGHRALAVDQAGPGTAARTNHFLAGALAGTEVAAAEAQRDSRARLRAIHAWLAAQAAPPSPAAAARAMAAHDGEAALCRHALPGGSRTLSCSLFACGSRRLTFSDGPPCRAPWTAFSFTAPVEWTGLGLRNGADR